MLFTPENYNEFDASKLHISSSFVDKYYVKQYNILYDNSKLEIETPEVKFPKGVYYNKFKQRQTCIYSTDIHFMKFIKKLERAINNFCKKKNTSFQVFPDDIKLRLIQSEIESIKLRLMYGNNIYINFENGLSPIIHVNGDATVIYSSSTPLNGKIKFIIQCVTYSNSTKNWSLTTYAKFIEAHAIL